MECVKRQETSKSIVSEVTSNNVNEIVQKIVRCNN